MVSGLSLPAMLLRQAAAQPDGVALEGLERRTWAAVASTAAAVGLALRDAGARDGDRVVIAPGPDRLAHLLGVQGVGAVSVMANAGADGEVLASLVARTDAVALLGAPVPPATTLPLAVRPDVRPDAAHARTFVSLVERLDPGAVAHLALTPRRRALAMLTHRNLAAAAAALTRPFGEPEPGERLLVVAPTPALEAAAFAVALRGGCTYVVERSLRKETLLQLRPAVVIAAARAWESFLVPVRDRIVDARPKRSQQVAAELGLAPVRAAVATGAPLAPDVVAVARALGLDLRRHYGTTEAAAVGVVGGIELPAEVTGRPLPGVELRLGADGEILLRSASVFAGYFRDEELSASVLDGDGWLHTGDVGVLDEQGALRVLGSRQRLLALADGTAVDPSAIEARLRLSRHIADARVVAPAGRLAALVEIDVPAVVAWAEGAGVWHRTRAGLAGSRPVQDLVAHAVDAVNAELPDAQRIASHVLVPVPLAELPDDAYVAELSSSPA